MSVTFSAKAGSLERLKVRMRWGWRRWVSQMRCTARKEMPTALATARPVQWVVSPGGSEQVSASTLAMVAGGNGLLPGGRVLSRMPVGGKTRYFGVDLHEQGLQWLRQTMPQGTFAPGRAMPPLDLEAESFDLIYSVSVLTHLDQAQEHAWLDEWHRLLKPGGLVIATFRAEDWVEQFRAWWRDGMRLWCERNADDATLVFLCELGPPPYAITDARGGELSDRWQEALTIRGWVEAIWADLQSRASGCEGPAS